MIFDFKNVHMGSLIIQRIEECQIDTQRICKFLKCSDLELDEILSEQHMSTELLMKFSMLLEYDFFRIYSQYLILYSPSSKMSRENGATARSSLPNFRKNIYTKEIIEFVIELVNSGQKSKKQIIEEYNIPKTTLHKWMHKYVKDL